MPNCVICNDFFPNSIEINGKIRNLQRRKYCLKCSPFGQHNTRKLEFKNVNKYCEFCGNPLNNKQEKFCNTNCQSEYYYNKYIEDWKNGLKDGLKGKYGLSDRIKKYLFKKYNYQCCKCGWHETNPFTNKIPLEVHHRDGDYTNNNEDNLELLCPNCHSLTETYKNGNSGNGRKERQKYNPNADVTQ